MIQIFYQNFSKILSFFTLLIQSDYNILRHSFFVLLLNLIAYLYVFIKFYKVLCYSKMTLEWFPSLNPYIWPFSMFQNLTTPYFRLWNRIFPSIRLENFSFDISGIIALEALNSLTYFCTRMTNFLIIMLEKLEQVT